MNKFQRLCKAIWTIVKKPCKHEVKQLHQIEYGGGYIGVCTRCGATVYIRR